MRFVWPLCKKEVTGSIPVGSIGGAPCYRSHRSDSVDAVTTGVTNCQAPYPKRGNRRLAAGPSLPEQPSCQAGSGGRLRR